MTGEVKMEEWRDIPGFEGLYEASNLGRIRSLSRTVLGRTKRGDPISKLWVGRVLRPQLAGKGYLFVSLSKDGVVTQRYVHQCVALAFIGPTPLGMEVAHGNGDKSCNEPWNLRYATPTGNNAEKRLHGTDGAGERNAMALLDEHTVRLIRSTPSTSQRELAAHYGVSQTCISDVQRRKTWAHVL